MSPDAYVLETTATTFSSQYAPVRTGATSPFELRGEVPRGQFHFLWPNTTINIAPGRANLSIGPVLPDGPESASRFLDYFFAPDVEASWIEQMLAWDEQVGEEDRVLVEPVQRGVSSGLLEHGRLISAEGLIRHFDELVTAALG